MVSPQDRRAAVAHVRQAHGASERRACGLVGQPRSTQRYEAKTKPEDTLPKRIAELAAERPRFGYRRLTALLKREGVAVWHGRVHRITKELRLQVPRRKRKRFTCSKPSATEVTRPNQRWGMDFVSDSLADGRSFRALAIVDLHAGVSGDRGRSESAWGVRGACTRATRGGTRIARWHSCRSWP